MKWFGKRQLVFCKDCANVSNVSKPELNIGEFYCRAVPLDDYVTRERKYRLCIMQNCDGKCKLFKWNIG